MSTFDQNKQEHKISYDLSMKTVLALLFMLLFATGSKADTWLDPSWEQMLDESDVIALVQYKSNGTYKASAKILTIYKGKLNVGDEVWISGFSNHYGPIDKMHKGDRYLVFLSAADATQRNIEQWEQQLVEDPSLKAYVEALKNNKAFYVWSPTSGDLKVKGKTVQYDLLQTSFYKDQAFQSLPGFESFLKAYTDTTLRAGLTNELMNRLKPVAESQDRAQDLMKLYLLGYNTYDALFEDYARLKNPSSRFALAQLLGNVKDERSKQLLLLLLKDTHSLVQGEAVRRLSKNYPADAGAVLLQQLKDANPYNKGPGNIMNPVRNELNGGKTQIIRTLGEIGYKPAIPELLLLLDTKDRDEFRMIVETLRKLGTRDYAAYINKHLENLDDRMVLDLCFIIKDDSLTECLPSLMNYVSRHDRLEHPVKDYAISYHFGLAHFPGDTVKRFLQADFLELMKLPGTDGKPIDTKQQWVEEYLQSFIHLGIEAPKDLVYDYMYNYYGINARFKKEPLYFKRKQELEDSLSNILKKILEPIEPGVKVSALALIDSNYRLTDYALKYEIIPKANTWDWKHKRFTELNREIDHHATIDRKHLIWATDYFTGYDVARNMPRFNTNFMKEFLRYLSTFADEQDLAFMENLKTYKYATGNDLKTLDEYILKASIRYRNSKH